MAETTKGRRGKRRPNASRLSVGCERDNRTPTRNLRQAAGHWTKAELNGLKARHDAREIARRYGVDVPPNGGLVRCFAAPASHSNGDRNPSCHVFAKGFRCYGCEAKGDVIGMVQTLAGCDFPEAVRRLSDGWHPPTSTVPRLRPSAATATPPGSGDDPPADRQPPPTAELWALWRSCLPVTADSRVSRWLRDVRAIDPERVSEGDLARALPPSGSLPSWARIGRHSWRESGHRLIVPTYDSAGRMVSVRARNVAQARAKELAPRGHKACGVLAGPLARNLLSPPAEGVGLATTTQDLVIAEGVPDFLTWGTEHPAGSQVAPAVLGIYSGSWSREVAERIPDGTRVVIATHHDPAGDRFAAQIIKTLLRRAEAGLIRIVRAEGRCDDA